MFDEMTKGDLTKYINRLSPADREELMAYIRKYNERMYYRLNPAEWMDDVLDIKLNTIIWSDNPGYREAGMVDEDGNIVPSNWDGDPDPIYAILEGLVAWEDVAAESATGTGKTFLSAAIMLWFMANFPMATVVTLAPKKDQLKKNLWGEVDKLFAKFKLKYPQANKTNLRIRMRPDKEGMKKWMSYGMVAGVGAGEESATKARGIHGEHVLFILEEANGIPEAVHEAVENTCTAPHNLRLALGNPNSVDDSLHQMAMRPNVRNIRVSGMDHPNVVGNDENKRPQFHEMVIGGAVSWKSINNRRAKYGPEPEYYNQNPLYKAMVRGICPAGSAHNMFTQKVLDVVQEYLEVKEERKDSMYIESESREWGSGSIPPLALEWGAARNAPVEGYTRVYEKVKHTHHDRYIIFGDVAEDKARGDWHNAVVLDRIKMKVVAMCHMRGPRKYYASEMVRLGGMYEVYDWRRDRFFKPQLCWEKNAGGALHLINQFMEYPNLYVQRSTGDPKGTRMKNSYGWYTSSKTRDDMMNALEEWGLSLREDPWRLPEPDIFDEMKIFEWSEKKNKYQAREGKDNHDDIMLSLGGALAVHNIIADPVPIPQEPTVEEKAVRSRRRRIQKKMRKAGRRRGRNPWDTTSIPSL